MTDQEKIAELSKLLKEARNLGLTFMCGTAYIRRSYIDKQDDLVRRINAAIVDVPPNVEART